MVDMLLLGLELVGIFILVIVFIWLLSLVATVVGLTRQIGSWLVDKSLEKIHGNKIVRYIVMVLVLLEMAYLTIGAVVVLSTQDDVVSSGMIVPIVLLFILDAVIVRRVILAIRLKRDTAKLWNEAIQVLNSGKSVDITIRNSDGAIAKVKAVDNEVLLQRGCQGVTNDTD